MRPILVVGVVLVALGLGGAIYASQGDLSDGGLLVAGLSGLALAIGMTCLGFGAFRRGYHYRPIGSPPHDMQAAPAIVTAPARARRD